eukprot:scaffold1194_cov127-Cylindrotheca_fusiformis.AAC.24
MTANVRGPRYKNLGVTRGNDHYYSPCLVIRNSFNLGGWVISGNPCIDSFFKKNSLSRSQIKLTILGQRYIPAAKSLDLDPV